MQASEARLPDTTARAALHLRIGSILRDLGRDAPNAAQAFRRAAELDPFSDGTGALVSLYDAAGDARGGLETVMRELADIRRALAADPLDPRRAKRLADYLAMARSRGASAPIAEAEAAVASVLQLVQTSCRRPSASHGIAFARSPRRRRARSGPSWRTRRPAASRASCGRTWWKRRCCCSRRRRRAGGARPPRAPPIRASRGSRPAPPRWA